MLTYEYLNGLLAVGSREEIYEAEVATLPRVSAYARIRQHTSAYAIYIEHIHIVLYFCSIFALLRLY